MEEYDNCYTIGAIHDANDMQSHKLGEVMFDEDDIFCPPSFDEKIYYDESMPPIYDDYCDDTYAIKKKFAYEESSKFSMLVDHEKNALGAGYIVELIHDGTKNYFCFFFIFLPISIKYTIMPLIRCVFVVYDLAEKHKLLRS